MFTVDVEFLDGQEITYENVRGTTITKAGAYILFMDPDDTGDATEVEKIPWCNIRTVNEPHRGNKE